MAINRASEDAFSDLPDDSDPRHGHGRASASTDSTTSFVLENLHPNGHSSTSHANDDVPYKDTDPLYKDEYQDFDVEDGPLHQPTRGVDSKYKRWLYIVGAVCLVGWGLALFVFLWSGSYKHRSSLAHNPDATFSQGSGKKITIDQLQNGSWWPKSHAIRWIAGADGEDGLLLERGVEGQDYLVVQGVHVLGKKRQEGAPGQTLMKESGFNTEVEYVLPHEVWPSPDLKTVLIQSSRRSNWRHSSTGLYWLLNVETQEAQALDPSNPSGRIQLAQWSPNSDSVVFVRDNNMFLREVDFGSDSPRITQITTDGGEEFFNGVPDWVYEEEVFSGNSATWWSEDGNYIAFLQTNETAVQEYPVQYFLSRPSGTRPVEWLEAYPEVRQIKYPKAGTPNPVVRIRFFDVAKGTVFDVPVENDFEDNDRLITEVTWAGKSGKILIRETNRESDVLKMVLVDVARRESSIVRTQDVNALDGGWFEISESTTFIPADPEKGRPDDGYVDTVIYEGYDHLAYFTPLDNPEPRMLTTGTWEVVDAPSAVDLENNLVYFVGTKESSIQRHIYHVKLDGSDLQPLTDASKEGYYHASFSKGAGYALLTYSGPGIPWQRVIGTPSNPSSSTYTHTIEENKLLADAASAHELPLKVFSTITIDGFELNVVERRPPHFDRNKKYPVLFYLYGGPGSQTVDKKFSVDFQSYVAAALGYIVVTVDGRGTGFLGRRTRCIIRGNIGYYEAYDQIATAKEWGRKSYVDQTRMAIWGWSYGGFMTLKTLEQDAGETFQYGMAVAPVTDWQFYDSIYTERWMHMPQHNMAGYMNASITNVTALGQNTRFLFMHGVADDNVHMQSSLTLIDKLDMAGVENYDVHFFPDSDHSIYFHNANRMVYDKLGWWLTNAFNGDWARLQHPLPLRAGAQVGAGE
ncbi:hypothetical protein FH972_024041 [Carpinus fangiana]|uniref:Dipeptidyl-peptidase IV n=1 Tax=Carpinus fangiana TaxID=176857 RepID=A0A5N6KXK4_9ROSI|nr:hypothetical protein FH972_024041 [Carpinus fangiana]